MSDLKGDDIVGYCNRCKRVIFTARDEAERDELAAEHDRVAHSAMRPTQKAANA